MSLRNSSRLTRIGCILVTMASACASAPKPTIESLNGKNYQAPIGALGGQLGLREGGSRTTIKGELVIDRGLGIPEPLANQKLLLMLDQKEIARTRSNAGGAFLFSGEIPDGLYVITLDSTKYQVSQKLKVSTYKMDGIQVFATEKTN